MRAIHTNNDDEYLLLFSSPTITSEVTIVVLLQIEVARSDNLVAAPATSQGSHTPLAVRLQESIQNPSNFSIVHKAEIKSAKKQKV